MSVSKKSNNRQASHYQFNADKLVSAIDTLPANWALTPVKGKQPYKKDWQKQSVARQQLGLDINAGKANGIGILTGDLSGGILAIDVDGDQPEKKLQDISGGKIPATVEFCSGKPGRRQLLFKIPDWYRDRLASFTHKAITTDNGELDFRYNRVQSVLPPSYHPDTGLYHWIQSPQQVSLAIAPQWLLDTLDSLIDGKKQQQRQQQRQQPTSSYGAIPLEKLLAKSNRELLANGEGEGNRNNSCFQLACDALGVENWCVDNNIQFEDDAENLIYDFGKNCDPAMDAKEIATCIKSAKSKSTPCLDDEKLWNCVNAFFGKRNGQSHQQTNQNGNNNGNGNGKQNGSGNGKQPFSDDLLADIDALSSKNLSGAALQAEFLEVAKKYGIQRRDVAYIYNQDEDSEKDLDKHRENLEKAFQREKASNDIALEDFLPDELTIPLKQTADYFDMPEVCYLTTLLPIAGSLLHEDTQLLIRKATKWYAKPILFAGLIGSSGTGKTPVLNQLMNALHSMQSNARDEWKAQYEEYQTAYKQAKKADVEPSEYPVEPKQRKYLTSDFTPEAISDICDAQEHGFLVEKGELSGLINGAGKYNAKGKGDDIEKLLQAWDGTPYQVDRASGKNLYVRPRYSILGTIQPVTLEKLIDFDDAQGFWARFLFASIPDREFLMREDDIEIDSDELLQSLYQFLENLPGGTYSLSKAANKKFTKCVNQLENQRSKENREGLRAILSKAKESIARIALVLHLINEYDNDSESVNSQLQEWVIDAAWQLQKYYLAQIYNYHEQHNPEDALEPKWKQIIELSRRKGWIKARDVRGTSRLFRTTKAADIRRLFNDLVDMGYGEIRGTGAKTEFRAFSDRNDKNGDKNGDSGDKVVTGCHHPETPQNGNYSQSGDSGDGFSDFSDTNANHYNHGVENGCKEKNKYEDSQNRHHCHQKTQKSHHAGGNYGDGVSPKASPKTGIASPKTTSKADTQQVSTTVTKNDDAVTKNDDAVTKNDDAVTKNDDAVTNYPLLTKAIDNDDITTIYQWFLQYGCHNHPAALHFDQFHNKKNQHGLLNYYRKNHKKLDILIAIFGELRDRRIENLLVEILELENLELLKLFVFEQRGELVKRALDTLSKNQKQKLKTMAEKLPSVQAKLKEVNSLTLPTRKNQQMPF